MTDIDPLVERLLQMSADWKAAYLNIASITFKEAADRIQSDAKIIEELRAALDAALEWIDAVPPDTPLPAMPGLDRDAIDELIDKAKRS